MYFNHIIVDKYLLPNYKIPKSLPPILIGSIFAYTYVRDELDLREKKHGKCDKELTDFGKCLDKYNDHFDACKEFLEAYKRCLQNK